MIKEREGTTSSSGTMKDKTSKDHMKK